MKVALFPNYDRQGTAELFLKINETLKSLGIDCFSNESLSNDELYNMCDIVITIGGDGTLIKHAKEAARFKKPCIGVNTGNLGFLANIEKDTVECLALLKNADCVVEPRMMIEVSAIKHGEEIYRGIALNDVVLSSRGVAKIADIKLSVHGDEIMYRADGVIVSTPTGSTAYSMSAGGPIIDPAVRCLMVTPVCSHSLTARPMILNESSDIEIGLLPSSRTPAVLSVDGENCAEVDFDTVISIKKSFLDAYFINLTGSTIYRTVSKKF